MKINNNLYNYKYPKTTFQSIRVKFNLLYIQVHIYVKSDAAKLVTIVTRESADY